MFLDQQFSAMSISCMASLWVIEGLLSHVHVKILIYKNRMVKRIIWEDEKRDQEETQDCQRSIFFILDPSTPINFQTLQKFKVLDLREISVILTALHCHFFFRYSSFFFLPGKQILFACYLLSQKHVSIKTIFFYLLTVGFLYSLSCQTI